MADIILTNQASVIADYGSSMIELESNIVDVPITEIEIIKTAKPMVWVQGELTYSITVAYHGDMPLNGMVLTDMIDISIATLIPESVMLNGNSIASYYFDENYGRLTVDVPHVAPGEIIDITFRVRRV